jgi:hypothetical protein
MNRRISTRFRISSAAAVISSLMFIATLINGEWIEETTGINPDAGSGATEWMFVVAFAAVAVVATLLARHEWRTQARAN